MSCHTPQRVLTRLAWHTKQHMAMAMAMCCCLSLTPSGTNDQPHHKAASSSPLLALWLAGAAAQPLVGIPAKGRRTEGRACLQEGRPEAAGTHTWRTGLGRRRGCRLRPKQPTCRHWDGTKQQ